MVSNSVRSLGILLLLISVTQACELGAVLEAGMACANEGVEFNLTKYFEWINDISSLQFDSTDDFFAQNSLSDMAKFWGELEPAVVWLMDSFYTKHLAARTADNFIRPYFGDMSGMDQVFLEAMESHCKIIDELASCIVTKLNEGCSKLSDATKLIDVLITPIRNRYCDGITVRPAVLNTFESYFDDVTNAFSCAIDTTETTKIVLRDIEDLDGIDFERALRKCNAMPVGSVLEEWYQFTLQDMFENFNDTNIVDLLDLDLPAMLFSMLRPMADCFLNEFKPHAAALCPSIDVDSEIENIANLLRVAFPVFPDEQEYVMDMMINPWPTPNIGTPIRSSLAMLGDNHIYDEAGNTWVMSCALTVDSILFAVGPIVIYRTPTRDLVLVSTESILALNLRFSSENGSAAVFTENDFMGKTQLDPTNELQYFSFTFGDSANGQLDGNLNSLVVQMDKYGVIFTITNPSGDNWVLFVRGGEGLFDLGYGFIFKDCPASDNSDKTVAVGETASSGSNSCANKCSSITSEMVDPCKADCANGLGDGLVAELSALADFTLAESKKDRSMANRAVNRDSSKDYDPCSVLGFVENIGSGCFIQSSTVGFDGDFASVMSDIGVIEPYALYGMTAYYKTWLVGPPVRRQGYDSIDRSDYSSFIARSKINAAFEGHCEFFGPFSTCLARNIKEFCPTISDELTNDYLDPLNDRYCEDGADGAVEVKQSVVNDMMDVRDELTTSLGCLLDLSNTTHLVWNETLLQELLQKLTDRCGLENIFFYITQLVERGASRDQVITVINNARRIVRNPVRCAIKVLAPFCPDVIMTDLVDKLIVHLNRVTAGVLEISADYFFDNTNLDYGSVDRVSLWAVGDPHIKHLGTTKFSVCDSPGSTIYFKSENRHIVEFQGVNTVVRAGSNATVLTEIKIDIYAPDAVYGVDEPAVSYHVSDGNLKQTFSDNTTQIDITSQFAVTLRYDDVLDAVFLTDSDTGLLIAISPFRNFYNVVIRGAREYVETATGLMVDGCGSLAVDAEEASVDVARRRRKRGVSQAQCETACAPAPDYLQTSCRFDCLVMEDTTIGEAHMKVGSVEEAVVEEDVKIQDWFPDPVKPSSGGLVTLSLSLLIFAVGLLTI